MPTRASVASHQTRCSIFTASPEPAESGLANARPCLNRLQAHHEERLREVKAQSERCGVSAREVMKGMFRRELGLHEQTFALGEALAHLHLLWHRGDVRRRRNAEGIYEFTAAD